MALDTTELNTIKTLQQALTTFPQTDYERNENIRLLQQASPWFSRISELMQATGLERNSVADRLQYDLRSTVFYAVKDLLQYETRDSRRLLDDLFDGMPALSLADYEISLVCQAHQGWFIPLLRQQLLDIVSQATNRSRISYQLYLTYPDLKRLATDLPELASEVLPLIFTGQWGIGYRAAVARQLYDQQLAAAALQPAVNIWQALEAMALDDQVLQDEAAHGAVIEWTQHQVKARLGSERGPEIQQLEPFLQQQALAFPDSRLAAFVTNKWQGGDWKEQVLHCGNGWQFTLRRWPYIAACSIWIPGGEVSRDQVVASAPEQQQWLCQQLAELAPDHWHVSWVINFHFYGEAALQQLLQRIEALGVVQQQRLSSDSDTELP